MKAVMISIQPKWVKKIANREKTIEVRKTAPKIATPFKCYIYCTFPKKPVYTLWLNACTPKRFLADGKVVGEFTCDEIIFDEKGENQDIICENACLTRQELVAYAPRKTVYGWHISDLKIYDKPKEIGEFKKPSKCPENIDCCACKYWNSWTKDCAEDLRLTRPFQSWGYVEEL